MLEDFSTALDAAFNHLSEIGESDLFSVQHETELLLKHQILAKEIIHEIDKLILANIPVDFLPKMKDLFSLGRYKYREGTLLDPLLNLYATTVLLLVSPTIEASRIGIDKKKVFSYRISEDLTYHWFNPDIGWSEFNQTNLRNAETFAFVGTLDIAQFYQSIRSDELNSFFSRKCFDSINQRRMLEVIKYLDIANSGLPVGGSISRIMAETVLCEIDHELDEQNVNFTRFVDDYRIFADSEVELQRHIYTLNKHIRKRGLYINRHKISVVESRHFVQELTFHKSPIVVRKPASKAEAPIVEKPFFDPYSELVIGRAEALKSISGLGSIADTMRQEVQKSIPDQLTIKILISALHYASTEECFETLEILFCEMHRAEVTPVLLRAVNMLLTKKSKLSSAQNTQISKVIEDAIIVNGADMPDSAIALLLFGLLKLNQKHPPKLIETIIKYLNRDNYSTYLGRQIIFLIIEQKFTAEMSKHLNLLCTKYGGADNSNIWLKLALISASNKSRMVDKVLGKINVEHDPQYLFLDFLNKCTANVSPGKLNV